jgi:erythronate-4-phosphate dehydrogenase
MDTRIKIIADNKIPFLQNILEPYAEVEYLPGADTGASQVKTADALITRTRTKCTENILQESKVKIITTATIGFDHIDTQYCAQNKIEWTNAPGCNSGSVKQYIASVLAILATKKQMPLANKTLGIIGVGNVGSKVKTVAEALGMRVLLNDPPRAEKEGKQDFTDLDILLSQSDIITFHVPLQRSGKYKTFHLGNDELFAKCKKEVIIINSSRGEVINNADLLDALKDNRINEAILDVWENEPDIDPELLKNVLIATPHIAGYSVDGKANGTAMSVQAISRFFNLPLKQWYPENLPVPENPLIEVDASNKSLQEILAGCILHTYNIMEDDGRLRENPSSFEQQRGSYPIRREFGAYQIKLNNGSDFIKKSLNKIGFNDVQVIYKDL